MVELLIQFLSLFIPATVAVGGSYILYHKKQEDQREALRWSLLSELTFMETLEAWPKDRSDPRLIPLQKLAPTQAYEANANQLGMLTVNEIANVSRFYSTAQLVNNGIKRAHQERKLNPHIDIDFSSLQADIAAMKDQRENAIEALNDALKEENDRFGSEGGDEPSGNR